MRAESFDTEDVVFLVNHLKLQNIDEVLQIVGDYYPQKEIKAETKFQLEEIFANLK